MTMDLLHKARQLEATLARSVDDAARRLTQRGAREPLEIANAIVDTVCARVEPAGRGNLVFPYNTIRVCVAAGTRDRRLRFEAVLAGDPPLDERILTELARHGAAPARLAVTCTFVDAPEAHWEDPEFHVELDRVALDAPNATVAPPERLALTVLSGATAKSSYVFANTRINIGRCAEVRDAHHRLLRTNHVAFLDAGADENGTVSRHHAHIEFVAEPPAYRLCDDGSVHGTAIVRHGRTILVPAGSRGVRLQSGDEIALGEARLRVRIG
jgi:hypothetical protein